MLFLFEFMDQPWLPASLHATLREVLAFHLRVPLGYYYRWAADAVLQRAASERIPIVAELGAGAAGFSEELARRIRERGGALRVEICDLRPDPKRYRGLERDHPGILRAHLEPLDFTRDPLPDDETLIVLSAAFHHVPLPARDRVLSALARRKVVVFESVTRNLESALACAVGFVPALATPLYFWGFPGRWNRVLWCWLIPVAPLMVAWDGVVSCLRCWNETEWRWQLQRSGVPPSSIRFERKRLSHLISW